MKGLTVERLNHQGIVAGVSREIGLAAYLDVSRTVVYWLLATLDIAGE